MTLNVSPQRGVWATLRTAGRLAGSIARRDLRGSRRSIVRLVLILAVGIAGSVATLSLRGSAEGYIETQAKSLLGADYALSGKVPFEAAELESFVPPGDRAREVQFRSMAGLPRGAAQLVQVRALEPNFPLYGDVETTPAGVWRELANDQPIALVEAALAERYSLGVGDDLKLGDQTFVVRGIVSAFPGALNVSGAVAPRVFIPFRQAPQTKLLERGSVADHMLYVRASQPETAEAVSREVARAQRDADVSLETAADRRRQLGEVNENVQRFLTLVAVACMVLAGSVAATTIFILANAKRLQIAVLKCCGVRSATVVLAELITLVVVAVSAWLLGLALGLGLAWVAVWFADSRLGVGLAWYVDWAVLWPPVVVNLVVSLAAAAPGLLLLRGVSAAAVVRGDYGALSPVARWVSGVVLVMAIPVSLMLLLADFTAAVYGSAAFAGVALLTWGVARVLRSLARFGVAWGSFPRRFAVQQFSRGGVVQDIGLIALAMALVVAMTVIIADHLIAQRVARVEDENSANLFVYDLQVDQVAQTEAILKRHEARIVEIVPIVLMRLASVKGVESDTLLRDPASTISARTLRRDYWSSYRAEMVSNEEIIAGQWVSRIEGGPLAGSPVPVSLEDRLAGRLGVTVGDSLEFDIQGVRVPAVVSSLRNVFWERMRRNALVIFPDGPLNDAPQFRFLTARVGDARTRAVIQRELADAVPGVSVVDVSAAVRSVTDALGEIRGAIAGLTALVALVALIVVVACADLRAGAVRDGNRVLQLVGARRNLIVQARRLESVAESLGALVVGLGAALGIGAFMAIFLFRTGVSYPWSALVLIGACGVLARFVVASAVLPRPRSER